MSNEIKIQLATYLKDAGIKATRQQVNKLADDIGKVNQRMQGDTDKTVGSLGRLPGAFGKIQSVATGAFGSALAAVAAFKVGCDIGQWISDKVIAPLFGIRDPIEELKKQNELLKKQAEEAAQAWADSFKKWESGWETVTSGADKARTAIEDATKAYLAMQQAQERVAGARDNAELLGLERDKFNAMSGAATPEEAAAMGKYHDVLIAEAKSKQEIARFDRASAAEEEKIRSSSAAILALQDKRNALKQQAIELDRKIAAFESQEAVDRYGFVESNAQAEKLAGERAKIVSRIEDTERELKRRRDEKAAAQVAAGALEQERKNIEARAELELDQRKKAYDDYVAYVEEQETKRAEEDRQRQQAEIDKQIAAEKTAREKMERDLAQQRLADIKSELAAAQAEQSAARGRANAAESGLTQAWGLYRNKGAMQAAIDEYKAQQAAEAQWEKDFARLKSFRRDWRTADFGTLSAEDEAVRRVALAKEEKEAADKHLAEIEENTTELAESLKTIEAAFNAAKGE